MRLFLIDGSSFCYRAFYAIRNLSTSKGQPTNAIYGFVTMLKKLLEEENPDYLAVAFDRKEPTFRHRAYEAYKEHRPPMPEGLSSQIPWIKEILKAFRISIFEQAGYEADDILGTIALKASYQGFEVFLVTGDKDAFQLVGKRIRVYRPTRQGHEIIDEKALSERWHIRPSQVVDLMSLMGDQIDAIPGVPGIGEKTALKLIQRFGSVEKLLEGLKDVPFEKARTAISEHKEKIDLSRRLATLDTQVPMDLDFKDLKVQRPDPKALRRLFQTLEFRSLLKEISPSIPSGSVGLTRVDSLGKLKELLSEVSRSGSCGIAVVEKEDLFGVGVSVKPGSACLVFGDLARQALREVGRNSRLTKICPDLKETLTLLTRGGIAFEGPYTDPSLASYLLDPGRPSHRIEDLALDFLGESIPSQDPLETAGLAAEACLRLMPGLERKIEERSLTMLLRDVEIPLSHVLARMEVAGIAVDLKELEALSKEMRRQLENLTDQIQSQAGEPININSPKQLAGLLFERLKLPVIKRTKTSLSTDEEVLRRLAGLHSLPGLILEYREVAKLSSTYAEVLPKLIDPKTGRIHTLFHQTVTATGRLSSSDPNLQNIPIRTELGRRIRKAFVPSLRENVFLSVDYSQIELRILAHLSKDEALVRAFREGADIHRVTAAEIFHIPLEEVSDQQRAVAKTINFGILYGMTPFGLAKELGIDPSEAEGFIDRYFARYPKVKGFLAGLVEEAREKGYSTTIFQRRRFIPEIHSPQTQERQFAERTAINTPIQGSAADLIKVAMVAIDRALQEKGYSSRMLLTVHDELVFEIPRQELDPVKELVKQTMESPSLAGEAIRLEVPILVKLKSGDNWLEASHG